jgi:hypothetical protein
MVSLITLDIPAPIPNMATSTIPVYRHLMQQPDHWMRQAFFVGRPKLPISRVVESMRANSKDVKETAQDWSLSQAALAEAVHYYHRFHDLVEADAADELALSEELTQQ